MPTLDPSAFPWPVSLPPLLFLFLIPFSFGTARVPHPRGPSYRKTFRHAWVMYVVVRETGGGKDQREPCVGETRAFRSKTPVDDAERLAGTTKSTHRLWGKGETRQTRAIFDSSPGAAFVNNSALFCTPSFFARFEPKGSFLTNAICKSGDFKRWRVSAAKLRFGRETYREREKKKKR